MAVEKKIEEVHVVCMLYVVYCMLYVVCCCMLYVVVCSEVEIINFACVMYIHNAYILLLHMIKTQKSAGPKWYNLPATPLTPELKNDLRVLSLRPYLDPKHFYKADKQRKRFPKHFQVISFWFWFGFVLFLFCFCFVFVLFLFCFCFVFVLFLFCFVYVCVHNNCLNMHSLP